MSNETQPTQVDITLDVGTAYDLLTSLTVLHSPKKFAVRGAWASGMLARLSPASRAALVQAEEIVHLPVHVVPSLPAPRSAEMLLWSLAGMDPAERMRALSCSPGVERRGYSELCSEVVAKKRWDAADLRRLQECLGGMEHGKAAPPEEKLRRTLDAWADAEAFGEAYLTALRDYYDVFFREEEKRIVPAIDAAAERIEALAKTLPLPDLIETISSGVRYDALPEVRQLILAPSFWITPLILHTRLDASRMLFVFGARGSGDAIVPGETVPDGLVRALKALSDPTRLRILRLVAERPMGAAELARSLRLRTPTVLHHLHALRLSALLQIRVPEDRFKGRTLVSLRPHAARDVFRMLEGFLHAEDPAEVETPTPWVDERSSDS